jgi:ABC-type transporter Mla MlaB component
MRQEAKHLVLDLQGVRSIDRAGVALLKCWTQDGVALRRPSPFVQALLETQGLA